MKRFLSIAAVAALSVNAVAADDMAAMQAELKALKAQVEELKKGQEGANLAEIAKQVKELKVRTGGDNVKWDIDYRATYDAISYKMQGKPLYSAGMMSDPNMAALLAQHINNIAGSALTGATVGGALGGMGAAMMADSFLGATPASTATNGLLANRLILGMKAAPTADVSFIGKLSYNKAFGDNANHSQGNNSGFGNFDWVTNENPGGNDIKLKEAYAIYFGKMGDVDYTASIGRRPSYDGLPGNMREGNANPNSPLSHLINVEYDGASFLFNLEKVTSVPGMSFKLCMGRGLSNATDRFDFFGPAYSKDTSKNGDVDLAGFIFVPFDNGQYSVHSMFFKANNLIGFTQNDYMNFNIAYMMYKSPLLASAARDATDGALNNAYTAGPVTGNILANLNTAQQALQFKSLGSLTGGTLIAMANGIGSGLGEFMDNTNAFVSYAATKTSPKTGAGGMLGSTEDKFGSSWYVGVQTPLLLTSSGRFGLEYNKGSKYWRSMTYGEDTMIGSKLATRGNAIEAYVTQPLTKNLDAQIRYTKINNDYTGGDSFFGYEGRPLTMAEAADQGLNPIKSATDIRAYLRYRY